MVGFANITSREMCDHLLLTFRNITTFDLENNFEQMRKASGPQYPVETLFKQIKDCADFSEAGGVVIEHPQQINMSYAKIFAIGNFMSACRRCSEKETSNKTWVNFKVHFAEAHLHHKQIQGDSESNSGYHA
jgi:hypothetical protein